MKFRAIVFGVIHIDTELATLGSVVEQILLIPISDLAVILMHIGISILQAQLKVLHLHLADYTPLACNQIPLQNLILYEFQTHQLSNIPILYTEFLQSHSIQLRIISLVT